MSKTLSIIIPVFNEKNTIREIISAVKNSKIQRDVKKEIIVIDDGSTDGTKEVLSKITGIKFYKHSVNMGKGRAMKTGLEKATGDIILTQDADLEYDPKFYSKLIQPILKGHAKVVYGSRFLYVLQKEKNISFLRKAHEASYFLAYLGGRIMTGTTNVLYGTKITDEATGYKVFTREVLNGLEIESRRFEFCPELTAKIARLGYRILEVPISYKPRTYAEGKKINWVDGIHGIYTLLKYRFNQMKAKKSNSAKFNKNLENVTCNICGADDFDIVYPELPGLNELDPKDLFSSSSHSISMEQIVKCKKCGLVYVNPRFKSKVIVSGYSGAVDHDYISQEKARLETFKRCLSVLNQYSGEKGRLLDVGAAAGYFVKVAQDDGWKAEGIEPSRWMSKYAKENLGIKVQPGVVHDYKFKSGSFDAITYWDVLEHVPDPLSDLTKTGKLLRKGGTLIVNYPDFGSLPAKIFKRKWWFILSIHLWYFTPATITKILNKAGFKVIKIQPHYQALELGYLVYRLKQYTELGYKVLHLVFRVFGLLSFSMPYYAGQTMVIARKK